MGGIAVNKVADEVRVGEFAVQRREARDGGRCWIVGHPNRGLLYTAACYRDALAWVRDHQ
jgi:hypothetical protein